MGINFLRALNPIIRGLWKYYGLSEKVVEIEPGTLINFWAPSQSIQNYKKKESNLVDNKKKNKPAVVLLHGFAGTGILTWFYQVASLAGNYAVYVPDLVFFGGSISDSSERSPTFQAECLAKGLKLLGVEKCTVVGCSYGGIVGSRMAELYPKLVKCLVFSNSNVGFSESHSKAALERIVGGSSTTWAELLLPNEVEGLKVLLRGVVDKPPWFPNWVYKHYLEVMFSNRKQRAELTKELVIKDLDFRFPDFSQKIYILAGEKDKIFDLETVQKTQSELGESKCTLICIKKAAHLVHLERPFVYNRYLNKILASVEEDGPLN